MAPVANQKDSGMSADLRQSESSARPRRHPWLWILLLVVLVMIGYTWRSRSQVPAAAANQKRGSVGTVPVVVASVENRDVPVYLRGLGSVTAFNTVTVKSRVDGQILQVAFREGHHLPGLRAAVSADHDDYHGGATRRAAAGAGGRDGSGIAPAAGHQHRGRPADQPASHPVYDPGCLSLHRSAEYEPCPAAKATGALARPARRQPDPSPYNSLERGGRLGV